MIKITLMLIMLLSSAWAQEFQQVTCLSFYTYETSNFDDVMIRNMDVLEFKNKDQIFEKNLRDKKMVISTDKNNDVLLSNLPETNEPRILKVMTKASAQSILMNANMYDHQMSALDIRCYLNCRETPQLKYLKERFLKLKNDKVTEILMSDFNKH